MPVASIPFRRFVLRLGLLSVCAAALCVGACATPAGSPGSDSDPTTRALSDPMNYSPGWDDTDVTGGGTTDFNSKAFKKDVDHVVNP
ncbi:MAG: hypothetical protein ABR964_01570 [Tepidisphaeraceae bacterium]|jgi:hypothetical protein